MPAGIRQYDIWIDGRKLSPRFLEDEETMAGHRVLLAFDGRVTKLDTSTFEPLKRTQKRKKYAKLGGYSIESAAGRRERQTGVHRLDLWLLAVESRRHRGSICQFSPPPSGHPTAARVWKNLCVHVCENGLVLRLV